MNPQWLLSCVRSIAAICMAVAMADAATDGEQSDGLRRICELAAAASVVRMAIQALERLV